jgi:hypothetical protein
LFLVRTRSKTFVSLECTTNEQYNSCGYSDEFWLLWLGRSRRDVRGGGRRVWRRSDTVSFISCHSTRSTPPRHPAPSSLASSKVLPVLAYVRRRVVQLPSRNCTSVLLVFVTSDWTVPLILSLLTNWGLCCLLFTFTLHAC